MDLVPDWATAVPNISTLHTEPAKVGGGATPPMPWQQLVATVEFFLTAIVGQIAIALGGIEIFGWKPLEFLADWGHDVVDQASNAYLTAIGAQSTANTAQTNATSALSQIGSLIVSLLTSPASVIGHLGQDMIDGLQDALAFLTSGVSDAATGLANLIQSLLHDTSAVLGPIPQQLVNGLEGALGAVTSGLSTAAAFIQNVINTIWSALRRVPLLGGFAPSLPDLQAAITDQQANQQNFTISAIVSDYRNNKSYFRHAVGDVSYPEYMNNRTDTFGETDTATTVTAHTHALSVTGDAYTVAGGRTLVAGASRGVYIGVSTTGIRDTICLNAWCDVGGPASNIQMATFREREDGSLYQIFTQDITSLITGSSGYMEVTLPELLVVNSGEQYMVRIYNGGTNIIRLRSMQETEGAQEQGFYYSAAPLATATEYTAAEAAQAKANTTNITWIGLACKNMPTTDKTYSDDANRGSIGGQWYRKSSTAALLDVYERAFGYTGSVDGSQSAIYIAPTDRDVSRVEANLYINAASSAREGVLLHCNRSLSQIVYLGVNSTSAKIYSGSHTSLTERASLALGGTGLWSLYYDSANDQYVALKDGADIGLKWTGVSTAVSHGSDYRYGGIRIEMASAQQAGTLDNWTLYDWLIAVPATVVAPMMLATATISAPDVRAGAVIAAPLMTATATAPVPTVEAGATIQAPAMEATATMPAPGVSDNSSFPYTFPYYLG